MELYTKSALMMGGKMGWLSDIWASLEGDIKTVAVFVGMFILLRFSLFIYSIHVDFWEMWYGRGTKARKTHKQDEDTKGK